MSDNDTRSHEASWRLYRLEDQVAIAREKLTDHERRIGELEDETPATMLSPERIKETLMIVGIGVAIGSMLATGDPAGVALIVQKLLGKG